MPINHDQSACPSIQPVVRGWGSTTDAGSGVGQDSPWRCF
jgi:hypothetical protein